MCGGFQNELSLLKHVKHKFHPNLVQFFASRWTPLISTGRLHIDLAWLHIQRIRLKYLSLPQVLVTDVPEKYKCTELPDDLFTVPEAAMVLCWLKPDV